MKDETCQGKKKSKEWLCSSADGSEKLKPLVIWKFANLRCLKNISTLLCIYTHKNAWMTTKIL
jgi:hypothetical protein